MVRRGPKWGAHLAHENRRSSDRCGRGRETATNSSDPGGIRTHDLRFRKCGRRCPKDAVWWPDVAASDASGGRWGSRSRRGEHFSGQTTSFGDRETVQASCKRVRNESIRSTSWLADVIPGPDLGWHRAPSMTRRDAQLRPSPRARRRVAPAARLTMAIRRRSLLRNYSCAERFGRARGHWTALDAPHIDDGRRF
jgi:hypothetical protein